MMPRMAPLVPPVSDPSLEVLEIYSKACLASPDGSPLNIFGTLAHHPRLLKRFTVFGGLFLGRGTLPPRERELVILRTAWRCGSEYEWGQHVVIGRREGLTDEEIEAVTRPVAEAGWPPLAAALLAVTDELLDDVDVSDGTGEAARAVLDDQQFSEAVMLVGQYRMVAGFLKAARVQREPGVPGWPGGRGPAQQP